MGIKSFRSSSSKLQALAYLSGSTHGLRTYAKLIQELGLDWEGSDLEQALSRLPEVYRTAVLLVDVEELPYEEAAQTLDCPVGTLRSRLFRGRKAPFLELKNCLRNKKGWD